MSQQFPPPGQPQQPGYGYPPPPQPKKSSAGKIVGFSCLGIVGLVVLLGIIGALLGGGSDDKATKDPAAPSAAASPAPAKQPETQPSSAAPEKKAAVEVAAKKAAFKASVLAVGDGYTSVSVTVTNNSSKAISVNPLYFTITDTAGTKHTVELAVDEDQIGTVDLAPGENITGTITGKGAFTAKSVAYTDGLIGKAVTANVS
ncbi:DUF4352 domain-containing protein [Streptomyces sp. NPDC058290]|uniref:DUF4352 domain-containing protein n=1 Tax=Streptomyces sp. NPDC058290 TaxID=3346426 RepID=UPI0036E77F0A